MVFNTVFQSLLDLAVSFILLLTTLTIKDPFKIHNIGILGWLECRLWNTKSLLWGLFKSSTWNLVALTLKGKMSVLFRCWLVLSQLSHRIRDCKGLGLRLNCFMKKRPTLENTDLQIVYNLNIHSWPFPEENDAMH